VHSNSGHLDACLATLADGFIKVRKSLTDAPIAISFAFPGPADYPRGIIGDLAPPYFRGGAARDAIGNAFALIDGLAVIGGGVSGPWPLFLPSLVGELNGNYIGPDGYLFRRLASAVFSLENPVQLDTFLKAADPHDSPPPGPRHSHAPRCIVRCKKGSNATGKPSVV